MLIFLYLHAHLYLYVYTDILFSVETAVSLFFLFVCWLVFLVVTWKAINLLADFKLLLGFG